MDDEEYYVLKDGNGEWWYAVQSDFYLVNNLDNDDEESRPATSWTPGNLQGLDNIALDRWRAFGGGIDASPRRGPADLSPSAVAAFLLGA